MRESVEGDQRGASDDESYLPSAIARDVASAYLFFVVQESSALSYFILALPQEKYNFTQILDSTQGIYTHLVRNVAHSH